LKKALKPWDRRAARRPRRRAARGGATLFRRRDRPCTTPRSGAPRA